MVKAFPSTLKKIYIYFVKNGLSVSAFSVSLSWFVSLFLLILHVSVLLMCDHFVLMTEETWVKLSPVQQPILSFRQKLCFPLSQSSLS